MRPCPLWLLHTPAIMHSLICGQYSCYLCNAEMYAILLHWLILVEHVREVVCHRHVQLAEA